MERECFNPLTRIRSLLTRLCGMFLQKSWTLRFNPLTRIRSLLTQPPEPDPDAERMRFNPLTRIRSLLTDQV